MLGLDRQAAVHHPGGERRYGWAMAPATTTTTRSRSVHRLRITLQGTSPPVWRRVAVPSSTTLEQLHRVLQDVMGWEDCHLHEFTFAGHRYGPRNELLDGWGTRPKDEAGAKLLRVAPAGARFTYLYDFGDGWQHEVVVETVEKAAPGAPGADGPVCLSGRRACPPEDCGGVWGYEHLLGALADPEHAEHAEMSEWVGDDHDPESFDLEAVNGRLAWRSRALALASGR